MNTNKATTMTKAEEDIMLRQIWEEIRYVRKKLDAHVESNEEDFTLMKNDFTDIKSELSGHKVKLGVMFSGIGVVMTGMVAWVVKHTGGG